MKFAWRDKIEDLEGSNSEQVEVVDDEYTEMLGEDESAAEFDRFKLELEDDIEIVEVTVDY
jgi:hypothetical protein